MCVQFFFICRFCLLETSCEQDDLYPHSASLKVNGKPCQLPVSLNHLCKSSLMTCNLPENQERVLTLGLIMLNTVYTLSFRVLYLVITKVNTRNVVVQWTLLHFVDYHQLYLIIFILHGNQILFRSVN